MTAESYPRKQHIAEIFELSKPLVNSKLVCLSDLNGEELEFMKEAWTKAEVERRRQIISHLVHLSENDFRLDFSSTFLFCLRDTDESVRVQSIAGLEIEENYLLVAPLVWSLKEDDSTQVRAAAAMALGKFTMLAELGKLSTGYTDKIYTALVEILDNKIEAAEVKRRALEAIAPLNLPRVKGFIENAYHSNDTKLKASSIHAMGRNCDTMWLPTLLTELNNDEAEIRYEAANACAEFGAEEAVPYLIRMTENEDAHVQETSIKALGEIGGEEAKQTLSNLVKNPQLHIQQAAKSALKELLSCEDSLSLNL